MTAVSACSAAYAETQPRKSAGTIRNLVILLLPQDFPDITINTLSFRKVKKTSRQFRRLVFMIMLCFLSFCLLL
jgi:hypothetical protein